MISHEKKDVVRNLYIACIVFITAVELLEQEISKHDIFSDKNIDVLIKPVKLRQIQDSLLTLVK